MADPLKIAVQGTTQEHLPVEDIVDDLVILKDGSAAMIMQVSSINFDLLSEKEQEAMVFAYGGLLNSLTFSIQILVRTTTKDVGTYLKNLKESEMKQNNPKLKDRIRSYGKFIEEIVKRNDVLSKTFYVAIPFSILELGLSGATSKLSTKMPFGGGSNVLPFSREYIVEKAKASLMPKKDHIMRMLARLGLEIKVLDTKELINLFYGFYNESSAGGQKAYTPGFDAPFITYKQNATATTEETGE